MRTLRYASWIFIALVAAFWAYGLWVQKPVDQVINQVASVGGPFDLIRTDGTKITQEDLKGQPHVLFFGFTHCPEICPTTLFEASGWLKQLGDDSDKIGVYFFTVDPERDTKEVLREYLTSFDPRIVGITGVPEKMAHAAKAYRVYAKKVDLDDGDYTVDHTASVFLMHSDGTFSGTISWGEASDVALEKIRNLIKKG